MQRKRSKDYRHTDYKCNKGFKEYEMKQLEIGNVRLKNNLILGPMAGVTDLPFRLLCAEQGAGLVCMEMVSAKGILYQNKRMCK